MIQMDRLPNTYKQSIKNKEFNTSAVTVWAEQDYFYLQPNYSKCLIPTVLKIDRKKGKITQIKLQQFQQPKSVSPLYFSFFIGTLNLNGKRIILLSQLIQIACSINSRDIFKITKPLFLFYIPSEKKNLTQEQAKILMNIVLIFEQGMYFSFAYNLTEPVYIIKKIQNFMISEKFNWGQPFQNELVNCNNMWSIPIIQGFVNKIQLYINAQKLKIILISRRSLKHGGPYQYTTGVTQKGNVANFVQTQQILCVNDFIFSFIQVRGSAPLFWSQKFSYGMPSSVSLQKSIQQNYKSFKLHLLNLLINREYENIILLNLMSKQSSSQKKITQNYQYLVKTTEKQKSLNLFEGYNGKSNKKHTGIHYFFFDLHSNCPNKNYKKLNEFINNQLLTILHACQFTTIKIKQDKTYEILNTQKGVVRSNCGTCIDRTNIMQSRLAAFQLVYILSHLNIKISSFKSDLQFVDQTDAFGTLYRNLWADNADNISKQYTGTGSTSSIAVRNGKLSYMTTIDHGMKSLVRAFRNITQQDQQKNKTILFMIKMFKQRFKETFLSGNYSNKSSPQISKQKKYKQQTVTQKNPKQQLQIKEKQKVKQDEEKIQKQLQHKEKDIKQRQYETKNIQQQQEQEKRYSNAIPN